MLHFNALVRAKDMSWWYFGMLVFPPFDCRLICRVHSQTSIHIKCNFSNLQCTWMLLKINMSWLWNINLVMQFSRWDSFLIVLMAPHHTKYTWHVHSQTILCNIYVKALQNLVLTLILKENRALKWLEVVNQHLKEKTIFEIGIHRWSKGVYLWIFLSPSLQVEQYTILSIFKGDIGKYRCIR